MRASSRTAVGLVAALLLMVTVAACGDDDSTGSATDTTASTEPAATVPADLPELTLTPIAELEYPTALTGRPGEPDALYVAEQAGRIRRIDLSGDAPVLDDEPILDLEDEVRINKLGGEPGLLGLVFSEDGDTLYVSFSAFLGEDVGWDRKVVEYTLDGDAIDLDSRRDLVDFRKVNPNHNGGDVLIGPDGYLYMSFGDDKRQSIAQDPTDLLAGILRVDPESPTTEDEYGIPADNPFADGGGAGAVWVYGNRNPWRFDIDPVTGDLWIGDVGFETAEEINRSPGGGPDAVGGAASNFGWPIFEGDEKLSDVTSPRDYVPPVYSYAHSATGCALIGGRVYRGEAIAGLAGAFIWADYCGREIMALRPTGPEPDQVEPIDLGLQPDRAVLAFGKGDDGEVYVLTTEEVLRIDPA